MPSASPIKLYLEALEAYNRGEEEGAAQKLAEALGAKEPGPVIINSLDKFLNYGSMPNDVALQIVATEVSKSRGNND
ncbi:hypothetical protein ES705_08413 [subsurface metagenome]